MKKNAVPRNEWYGGFAPLVLIVVLFMIGVVGYYSIKYVQLSRDSDILNNFHPTPSPVSQNVKDIRDCIPDEQKMNLTKNYLLNKWYESMATSGYWASLNPDGTTTEEWGLDYAGPSDKRPNSGSGSWRFENNELTLNSSTNGESGKFLSTEFRLFMYKGNIFAVDKSVTIVIGPSKEQNDDFFKNQIWMVQTDRKECKR